VTKFDAQLHPRQPSSEAMQYREQGFDCANRIAVASGAFGKIQA
jgi:hypothetical protein